MGGIVLRASLKYLSIGMKKMLHTYISMGVPHLGYFSGTDFCVEKGLNLINFLKPILSLKQLSGKDSKHQ